MFPQFYKLFFGTLFLKAQNVYLPITYYTIFYRHLPPFLLPALCLLHPVHRKPEEPVAVHSTYDNMTSDHRPAPRSTNHQTIATAVLTQVSPLLAAAFSRSRSCLSKRQNGVQRSCHQPNSDSERQQRSNILWSMNRVFKCINVLVSCTIDRRGELQIEWRNIIQPKK